LLQDIAYAQFDSTHVLMALLTIYTPQLAQAILAAKADGPDLE
jgi:hypothetical protein